MILIETSHSNVQENCALAYWPWRQIGKEHLHSRYKVNGPNKFRVCDDMLYGWCTHTMCHVCTWRYELKRYAGSDMPRRSGSFVRVPRWKSQEPAGFRCTTVWHIP